jgi:branched-chain amino acid transport system substrate-binding protein
MKFAVPFVVAALALSACGSRGEDPDTGATGGDGAKKTVKIGVIAPLSGDLSALGKGIQHSVELAVQQANEANAIPGWEIQVEAVDDEAKADVGKNGATKLAADDEVAGVVGNLNSSVSQQTQPVFAAANIVQVSPANTGPSLTRGADGNTRPYATFFRTCATDITQGAFAAKFLLDQGIKSVATIHDKKTYGQGLVQYFTESFKAGGGSIVAAETINPDESNYAPVVSQVAPAEPQAVYYGGEYPQAGPLSQQMKAAGLDIPLMGGDGIYDPTFIQLAGATSNGDLATSVGEPIDSSDAGKKFLADYEAADFAEPAAAYGGYSYDAAQAIIEGLKVALKDASDVKSTRQAIVDAVGQVSFAGVTGQVEFDEFGDTQVKVISGYKIEGGKWTYVKSENLG